MKKPELLQGSGASPMQLHSHALAPPAFLSLRHFAQISDSERKGNDPCLGSLHTVVRELKGTQQLFQKHELGFGEAKAVTVTRMTKIEVQNTSLSKVFRFIYLYFLQCSLVFYSCCFFIEFVHCVFSFFLFYASFFFHFSKTWLLSAIRKFCVFFLNSALLGFN